MSDASFDEERAEATMGEFLGRASSVDIAAVEPDTIAGLEVRGRFAMTVVVLGVFVASLGERRRGFR
jgi:hypothetical protein